MIFLDQSQYFATLIAINEIASFCIDNRLREIASFVFTEAGKARFMQLKDFEIKN